MPISRPWSIRDIDLLTLRLLIATVEEGSLVRAAEREGISPSSISRRISDLEARCGVTLLERRDRGCQPTAAGEMLYARSRLLVDLLERTILDMEAVRGGAAGQVRIHAHPAAALGALPTELAAFLADHPGIDVEIKENASSDVLHAVRTGGADIGVVPHVRDIDDLYSYPWWQDGLVVITSRDHRLRLKSELRFADLLGEPFIVAQDTEFLAFCRQQASLLGAQLKERAVATGFEGVRRMVAAGLGVAIVPAAAAYPFQNEAAIEIRPLKEPWAEGQLLLCVRDPQMISAATGLVLRHLRREHLAADDAQ